MHFWLRLPPRLRAQALAEGAAASGVRMVPGAAFGIESAPNAVRLVLGAPPSRPDLERALPALAKLW